MGKDENFSFVENLMGGIFPVTQENIMENTDSYKIQRKKNN